MARPCECCVTGLPELSSRHRDTCHDLYPGMHEGHGGFPHRRARRHDVIDENNGLTPITAVDTKGPRDRCAPIGTSEAFVATSRAHIGEKGLDAKSVSRPWRCALE